MVFDADPNSAIYGVPALASRSNALESAPEPTAGPRKTAALNRLAALHMQEVGSSSKRHLALRRFRGDSGGMSFVVESGSEPQAEQVRSLRLDEVVPRHRIEHIDHHEDGHPTARARGPGDLLRAGRNRTLLMKLNRSDEDESTPLAWAGYRFVRIRPRLESRAAGPRERLLSDIVARHSPALEAR